MDNESTLFQRTPAVAPWRPAAWLRITGDDSFSFLQGQFTNDLRPEEGKGAVYGLWLNHKGRVIADSFVLRVGGGEFWIGSYFCPAKMIRERLEAFIVADDVVIEDFTGEWAGLTVFGKLDRSLLPQVEEGALTFPGRRSIQSHIEYVFPLELNEVVSRRLGAVRVLSEEELHELRIREGIPAVPQDIGPGELPNEGGLEAVAISYRKGCYLGQEVMARLKSMGQVRRRLLRVKGTGAIPPLPAAIFAGERRIGELKSAAVAAEGFVGLALLSLLHLNPGVPLAFAPGMASTLVVQDAQ